MNFKQYYTFVKSTGFLPGFNCPIMAEPFMDIARQWYGEKLVIPTLRINNYENKDSRTLSYLELSDSDLDALQQFISDSLRFNVVALTDNEALELAKQFSPARVETHDGQTWTYADYAFDVNNVLYQTITIS